jgi:hypothetical protein
MGGLSGYACPGFSLGMLGGTTKSLVRLAVTENVRDHAGLPDGAPARLSDPLIPRRVRS